MTKAETAAAMKPDRRERAHDEGDEQNSDEIISVYGPTAERCTTLGSVALSLVVGTGERHDGQLVLVPYVECELQEEGAGADEQQPLTWILTLDNVAFLVEEFATDLASLMPALNEMASGRLKPARERIQYAVECVARANGQLATAGEGLRALLAE